MTSIIATPSTDINTPTSYVSRWIAQSHGSFQKRSNGHYSSSSSCECSPAVNSLLIQTLPEKQTLLLPTTWKVQARARLNSSNSSKTNSQSAETQDQDFQEKLQNIKNLLELKKKRFYRYISSASTTFSNVNPSANPTLADQVHCSAAVGEQTSSSPPVHPSSSSSSSSSSLVLENTYHSNDDTVLSSSSTNYPYHSCLHHHHSHHHQPALPCLVEESPSDSGLSDGTKGTHPDDIIDGSNKNAAIIDLSKPLTKEEMLAIIQIVKELWKKQFDCDMPIMEVSTSNSSISRRIIQSPLQNSKKTRSQYHSSPTLDKLSAELSDIKDKLKRFNVEQQSHTNNIRSSPVDMNINETIRKQEKSDDEKKCEKTGFVSVGRPLTTDEVERMQAKKDALIRRQIQRREEQILKNSARKLAASEQNDEYRLFEEYLNQRRNEEEQRRSAILRAHVDQKRLEADPIRSEDLYFGSTRRRNRLKRKPSLSSFLSFDEDLTLNGSSLEIFNQRNRSRFLTPQRNSTQFDFMSPSVTAPTAASRSKMNRAASLVQVDGQYASLTSLNSRATRTLTRPSSFFGGSALNLSKSSNPFQTPKQQCNHIDDDSFDLHQMSPLSISMNSLSVNRLNRSQTFLSTKSNKQAIINSLKQVALAGPANEKQRESIIKEIESSEARHFVLLFRDHRLQFRAVYMYLPDTDIIEKLQGIGPSVITELMVEQWYKYNSGNKKFNNIPIKHFSIQCDAVIIHNDFWQKNFLRR